MTTIKTVAIITG